VTGSSRRPAGLVLGATRAKDVVDATVALLAKSGDRVYPATRKSRGY
jgi:hypothetical protein